MFKILFNQFFYKSMALLCVLAFALGASGAGTVYAAPKIPTATSVSFSAFPAAGLPVTVTATIAPASATGTVAFTATLGRSKVTLPTTCASAPVSGGSASCTFTPASTGAYTFTAKFTDTKVYASSTGNGSVIVKLATSTALSFSASPVTGSPLTVTATVSPAATGTVDFTATLANDPVALPAPCTSAPLSNGQATCTFTPAAPGSYAFTAAASGDAAYAPSTGTGAATVMIPIPTTTIVADNATTIPGGPAPVTFGGTIVFTATVSSADGTMPNGTVQWTLSHAAPYYAASGSGIVGACQGDVPVVNGVATCSVTPGYYWDDEIQAEAPFHWGIRAAATFTPAAESGFGGSDSTNKITTASQLSCSWEYYDGTVLWFPDCYQYPFTVVSPAPGSPFTVGGYAVDSLGRNLVFNWWAVYGSVWTNTPSVTFPTPSGLFTATLQVVCPEGVDVGSYEQSFECDYPNIAVTFLNQYQG